MKNIIKITLFISIFILFPIQAQTINNLENAKLVLQKIEKLDESEIKKTLECIFNQQDLNKKTKKELIKNSITYIAEQLEKQRDLKAINASLSFVGSAATICSWFWYNSSSKRHQEIIDAIKCLISKADMRIFKDDSAPEFKYYKLNLKDQTVQSFLNKVPTEIFSFKFPKELKKLPEAQDSTIKSILDYVSQTEYFSQKDKDHLEQILKTEKIINRYSWKDSSLVISVLASGYTIYCLHKFYKIHKKINNLKKIMLLLKSYEMKLIE